MSLRRVFFIFLVALFGISAMTLYQVSQAVQRKEKLLAEKQYTLQQFKENKRVLKAEWSYLNRPDRLEAAARKVLDFDQLSIEKVTGRVEEIPEPLTPSRPLARAMQHGEDSAPQSTKSTPIHYESSAQNDGGAQ